MLTTLSNINLFVSDVEASLRFFRDALGLKHDAERSHPPGFALLRCGAMTLTLQAPETPGAIVGQSGSVEIGFEADDLPAMRDRLAAAGATVTDLQTMGWGSGFDATTPDGLRVSLFKKRDRG